MMEYIYNIIAIRRKVILIRKIIMILALIFTQIKSFLDLENYPFLEKHFYLPTFLLSLIYLFSLVYAKKYKTIGTIVFTRDWIKINKNNYSLRNISEIKIEYKNYYGETSSHTLTGVFFIKHGIDNSIYIRINNNTHNYYFQCLSHSDLLNLQKIVESYKSQGILAGVINKS